MSEATDRIRRIYLAHIVMALAFELLDRDLYSELGSGSRCYLALQ
jgi:hypothetical protein